MTDTTTAPADGAIAPEKNTEIPVQTSTTEPLVVATDPVVEPEAQEQQEEPEAQPDDQGGKKPPKLPEWAQKEIAKKAFDAREATRRAEAAEAELARLKAAATPAVTPNAADAQAAQQQAPAGGYKSEADFNAAVQAEANRRSQQESAQRAQEEFDAACNAAYSKGKADPTIGAEFDAAIGNLQQVGFMNREMLEIVVASDDPSKVLYELGSDPDRAIELMQMTPARRAVEIAKMAIPAQPKATPLSRAPRPVEPVEGSARPNGEPSDNDDDATWFAKRNAQIQRRYQGAA